MHTYIIFYNKNMIYPPEIVNICKFILDHDLEKLNEEVFKIKYFELFNNEDYKKRFFEIIEYACSEKYNEEVKILINNTKVIKFFNKKPDYVFGSYTDKKKYLNEWFFTIFRYACKSGNLEIVKYISEVAPPLYEIENFTPQQKIIEFNKFDYHPFIDACKNNHANIVEYFCKVLSFNRKIRKNYPFLISCNLGHLEIAKILYKYDPEVISYHLEYHYSDYDYLAEREIKELYPEIEVDEHSCIDYRYRSEYEYHYQNNPKITPTITKNYNIEDDYSCELCDKIDEWHKKHIQEIHFSEYRHNIVWEWNCPLHAAARGKHNNTDVICKWLHSLENKK